MAAPAFDFSGKDAPPVSAEETLPVFLTMDSDEFAEVQKQVLVTQAKLVAQEEVDIEEEHLINIWFRARRGIAMSVVKEKPKKEPAAKRAPAVKKTTKASVSKALVDDIFADLFN
jgi:hypothetical protein